MKYGQVAVEGGGKSAMAIVEGSEGMRRPTEEDEVVAVSDWSSRGTAVQCDLLSNWQRGVHLNIGTM